MRNASFPVLVFFGLLLLSGATSCGSPNTPLDADTRLRIDSISNAEIGRANLLHDSLCQLARTTVLPQLVDSIKKVREREIQEQLKTIPR
ncbi:MAG: hypothetical protein SFV22_06635 [Saprospiraceae bacterium]|nr:hypothetical protein [Saprospiraceae bacterium]